MTEPGFPNAVPSPPHLLLTMGTTGLYPPAQQEVAPGTQGRLGAPDSAPLLGAGKPLALLIYLALTPGRAASREFLMDLLWADVDGERGRHALRQTIWHVRQVLGESSLEGREELRLGLPLDADRDRFLAAVEAGDLPSAVERYTGPFLPAFAAPGGAEFEQWADRERDRLRGLFIRAADTLARRYLSQGVPREAVKLARRIREAEPLHEGGWRLLLEALGAANDRVQVLVEAEALEKLLRMEGREAEPATRTALRRVQQSAEFGQASGAPASLVAELVGREAEFRALTRAWETARFGPAVHLRLVAAAGLGKTRLLQDFYARLKTMGARTVVARANPGERDLPFALAADLAGVLGALPGASAISPAAGAALVSLNPALSSRFQATPRGPVSPNEILPLTIALAELVNALAYEAPIAILVDDLHWADASSLRVLDALHSRITGARVLVVTSTRPHRDPARSLQATTVLPLAPLSLGEVEALVTSIARRPPEPEGEQFTATLWRVSGGTPLHVLEALQQAIDNGHLALDGARWRILDRKRLDGELARGGSIAGRLRGLDRASAYLLTLLATAGVPCSTDLLARAVARNRDGILGGLAELERRGFITQARGEWEPAHDEIAALALDVADTSTRQAAACALGEALVQPGSGDDLTLRRALQLLLAAGAGHRIAPVLTAHRPGIAAIHPRAARVRIIADLLGKPENDSLVAGVAETLRPPRGRRKAAGLAAGFLALAVTAGVALTTRPPAPSDGLELVVVTRDSEGRGRLRRVPIRVEGWSSTERLTPSGRSVAIGPWEAFGIGNDIALGPSGWAWYHPVSVDNQRTYDIVHTDDDRSTILSPADRDDVNPTLSPDRRWIAFATTRWSPTGADDLDLAIMDTLGGKLRRLTTGTTVDHGPVWDPSGTRIAFIRKYREIRRAEVCVVALDAVELGCHALEEGEPSLIGGWLTMSALALTVDLPGTTLAIRYDLGDGSSRLLGLRDPRTLQLSPDGQWLLCWCASRAGPGYEWSVAPVADPENGRIVDVGREGELVLGLWNAGSQPATRMLDSLVITGLPDLVPLDLSHRPRVEGRNRHGDPVAVPPGVLRWRSEDPTTLEVEAHTGVIVPRREGTARVSVSAAGWRTTSVLVRLAGRSHTIALDEEWSHVDSTLWRGFGDPRPYQQTGPEGIRGLVLGGDGSFPSGLYSLRSWSAAAGIGLEALVSTPITRTMWQSLSIALVDEARISALSAWDHLTGAPEIDLTLMARACGAGIPAAEGALWVDYLSAGGGGPADPIRRPAQYRSGKWWRLVIQLFPDGSCGIAVDGEPLWRSEWVVPVQGAFMVWLQGAAVGSEPMIGRLTVWTGVRPGVGWAALDTLERKGGRHRPEGRADKATRAGDGPGSE